MKKLEYTLIGCLTECDKLFLRHGMGFIKGVDQAEFQETQKDTYVLTLSLSIFASEAAVDKRVRQAAASRLTLGLYTEDEMKSFTEELDAARRAVAARRARADEEEELCDDDDDEPVKLAYRAALQIPPKRLKAPRHVLFSSAVSTVITAVVLAVLLTFSLTTAYVKRDLPNTVTPGQGEVETSDFDRLEILDRLFRSASVLESPDREALITSVLKAYVEATGDVYAEYLTEEELQEQVASNNGEMCGLGITVTQGYLIVDGVDYLVISVAYVYPDSPAEAAGVQPGDHIMYVGKGDDAVLVQDVGYANALDLLAGEENTECSFTVYRFLRGADVEGTCEALEITAIRKKLTVRTVTFSHYTEDASVGVIRITSFNNTTRDQFIDAMEALKAEGCTSFVLDLRGNPGGLLSSVEDVLVLFLQEDDTIITVKDALGKESVTTVTRNRAGKLMCGTGEMTVEDIGRYRNEKISVLVNEYSASAAELFTSNIRDYELGTIVGMTTYGKGCGQTTVRLSHYGYDGALKLTTFYYCPPCGESYDGIGITPHVVVELSEEAQSYNINLLPHALDNQLAAAVASMK